MALQTQVIPINFGQGVDKKSDPKQVVAGKMLRLENALFTEIKSIKKRNGYVAYPTGIVGGGSLSNVNGIAHRGKELLALASSRIYSLNEQDNLWVNKGLYESVIITKDNITSSASTQRLLNSCSNSQYILNVWVENINTGSAAQWRTVYNVLDKDTNAIIVPDTIYEVATAGVLPCPRAVTLGASQLAFLYLNTSQQLICVRVSIASGVVTTATTTIGTDNSATTPVFSYSLDGTSLTYEIYDVQTTSTGAVVVYANTASAIKPKTINTSGAVVDTAAAYGAVTSSLNVNVSSTGQIWIYSFGSYSVYTSALVSFLAPTAITNLIIKTSVEDTTSSSTMYVIGMLSSIIRIWKVTNTGTVTEIGRVAQTTTTSNFNIKGSAYTFDGRYYFTAECALSGTITDSVSIVYMFTGSTELIVSGVIYYAEAIPVASMLMGLNDYGVTTMVSFIIRPVIYDDKVMYPKNYATGLLNVYSSSYPQYASTYLYINYDSSESYQSFEVNDVTVLNGGSTFIYDGERCLRVNRYVPPVIEGNTNYVTLGNMSDGTYLYYVVIVVTDKAGNIYRGTPSVPYSVTLSGGGSTQRVNLSINWLNDQMLDTVSKSIVTMEVYRTKNTETAAHLVSVGPVGSFFEDTLADVSIDGGAFIYTLGGIVENTSPPGFRSMVVHNNRVWGISSEDGLVWYSKKLVPGAGINFSDLLAVQPDVTGGVSIALSKLDDKLVLIKEQVPIVYSGDGANDLGNNSTLSDALFVPSDSGAISARSVASFPMGVMFKGPKGFYLLDRSLTTKYIGMSVEEYNTQDVKASTMDHTRSHIKFLTSSGLTLVYDYIFDQWSTFTNHEGIGAVILDGSYVYARNDGTFYKETAGYYLDDATGFSVLAQTAWLGLGGIQGFQRVRRFLMLGEYENGNSADHGLTVEAAYDFSETFSAGIDYEFGAVSTDGVFQYEERLPRQKCDTISLRVTEIVNDDELESVSLTDMSFEAGVKRGLNRVGSGQSVG